MTKPSHPPIPPNCPHFATDDIWHTVPDGNGGTKQEPRSEWFFHISRYLAERYVTSCAQALRVNMDSDAIHRREQRNVIASVARCAWLDEANRKYAVSYVDYGKATDNATAWAAWGRGEKWE